jgi:hypothetical protein
MAVRIAVVVRVVGVVVDLAVGDVALAATRWANSLRAKADLAVAEAVVAGPVVETEVDLVVG